MRRDEYARVDAATWRDPDWRGLAASAQWLYMTLSALDRPGTEYVLPLRPHEWADLAARVSPGEIWLDLLDLEAAGFVRVGSTVTLLRTDLIEPAAVYSAVYRERRRVTPIVRQTVLDRDGAFCRACRSVDHLAIDHVVALVRGGTSDLDNLAVLCRSCNSAKATKSWDLFLEERRAAHP